MRYFFCLLFLLPVLTQAQATETFWMQATTDVFDTWFESGDEHTNNGTDVQLLLGSGFGSTRHILISFPTLADTILAFDEDWVLSEARIEMYENGVYLASITCSTFYIVKPYIEAKATWSSWQYEGILPLRKEWGTAGANDTGSTWNESDASGDDRGGTSQGEVVISSGSAWKYIDIDTAWINSTITLDSVVSYVLQDLSGGLGGFHSSEYATDTSLTLRLRVIMEQVPAGPPDVRHSPEGQGQRHGPDGASVRHKP